MRGLSAGTPSRSPSGSINGFPTSRSISTISQASCRGRNLDVYAADLERVEVLEGPQGTLFGAGAQAGVIRYITNKPKLNVTEGEFHGRVRRDRGRRPNSILTAVLNLPLIADTFAVRGVIYDERRGGYINNVPGTFTRKPTDLGIHYANYPDGCVPTPAPACQVPPELPRSSTTTA